MVSKAICKPELFVKLVNELLILVKNESKVEQLEKWHFFEISGKVLIMEDFSADLSDFFVYMTFLGSFDFTVSGKLMLPVGSVDLSQDGDCRSYT